MVGIRQVEYEALNVEILAIGNYDEIAGAESQLIILNSGGSMDDNVVRQGTTIDNLRVTHKNEYRLRCGEALLNRTIPDWKASQKQK